MQRKAAGLEAETQAERRAQRDLKLVLAAAEKQAQQDSNERREVTVRYSPLSMPTLLHAPANPLLHKYAWGGSGHLGWGLTKCCSPDKRTDAQRIPRLGIRHAQRRREISHPAPATEALTSTNAERCVQASNC